MWKICQATAWGTAKWVSFGGRKCVVRFDMTRLALCGNKYYRSILKYMVENGLCIVAVCRDIQNIAIYLYYTSSNRVVIPGD